MSKVANEDSSASEVWLSRLACLNVHRYKEAGKGCAPHKPLLLLALMDMIEDRHLTEPLLARDAELVFRFQNYWPIVEARIGNRGDVRMPFHALGSDRDMLWQATLTDDGRPSTTRDTTSVAQIDPDFWSILQTKDFRDRARAALIGTYFPADEQISLSLACNLSIPDAPDIAALRLQGDIYRKSQEKGRCAKFRGQVVTSYFFTCALTGYCLTTAQGAFIVHAAHIRPLAKDGINDPKNGLALTPNSHWMFDAGLWTVDDQLKILVAGEHGFKDVPGPNGFTLRQHHGCALHLDPRSHLRPSLEFLAWHRKYVFLSA